MRTKLLLLFALGVFAAINYAIYEKQNIISHGEIAYLEIFPVDPRSIMQGDYMQLGYTVARDIPSSQLKNIDERGYLVIRPDVNSVGHLSQLYNDSEPLPPNDMLVRYHKTYMGLKIVPDSFFFQEQHGQYYQNAKYAMFKYDAQGDSVLVGLANENRELIEPLE